MQTLRKGDYMIPFKRVDEVIQNLDSYTTTYGSGDTPMFTAKDIAKLLKTLYFNFRINASNDDDVASLIDFIVYTYNNEIYRMFDVLVAEYNPIENYNKSATITDSGTANSTNYNVPVDSTVEKETSKTSVTNGNQHTESVSGNIGTMSTQTMIAQEIDIRTKYNIKMYVVQKFKEFYLIA